MAAHEPQPEFRGDEPLLLETPVFRLSIGPSPAQGISVAVRVDAEWRTIATAGWAQLVVVDGASPPDTVRRTLDLVPSSLERADAGALTLAGALDDPTLGHCHFDVDLEIIAERRVAMTYSVTPERRCRLVHFRGPHLLFDYDTLAAKDDALFPGLDWLVGPEESSATTNAAAALAVRSAPHPYKITVPLMALSAVGVAVGLWWDPLQLWCNAHAYPGALFALPEHDQNAPARGRMALFVPTPASRWTAENQTYAHTPYNVPPVHGSACAPRSMPVPRRGLRRLRTRASRHRLTERCACWTSG
jgi:hypothetical protein